MKTYTFSSQYVDFVIDYLTQNYAAVTRRIRNDRQGVMAIFIHEESEFRTGSYQTLTSVVESDQNSEQAILTVVGSGGGGGICNFNWGSQRAGEDTIINNVRNLIEGHSRKYDDWYFEGQQ